MKEKKKGVIERGEVCFQWMPKAAAEEGKLDRQQKEKIERESEQDTSPCAEKRRAGRRMPELDFLHKKASPSKRRGRRRPPLQTL